MAQEKSIYTTRKSFWFTLMILLLSLNQVFAQQTFNINKNNAILPEVLAAQSVDKSFAVARQTRQYEFNPQLKTLTASNKGDKLLLDFFSNKKYEATIQNVTHSYNGVVSITAKIAGTDYAYCYISVSDEGIAINADLPLVNEQFLISKSAGKNLLSRYNKSDVQAKEVRCESVERPATPVVNSLKSSQIDNNWPQIAADCSISTDESAPVKIRVLVVYTTAAKTWADTHGGIANIMNNAISESNTVMTNSLTNIEFELAYAYETDYTEQDNNDDLYLLSDDGDGVMDDVHYYRRLYRADLVMLYSKIENVGGLGWVLGTKTGAPRNGFAYSRIQQVNSGYTMVHEMGHNMGCSHHELQGGSGLFDYSFGWRGTNNSGRVSTVMTYETFGGSEYFPNIPYFSSPDINVGGTNIGTATANNALTLRKTKHVTARYGEIVSTSLSAITLNTGILSPTFDPEVTNYTVTVGNEVGSINVTGIPNETCTTVTGNVTGKALNVGENTVTIKASSYDGSFSKTYTITINRLPSACDSYPSRPIFSGNVTAPAGNVALNLGMGAMGMMNILTSLPVNPITQTFPLYVIETTSNAGYFVGNSSWPSSPLIKFKVSQSGNYEFSGGRVLTIYNSATASLGSFVTSSGYYDGTYIGYDSAPLTVNLTADTEYYMRSTSLSTETTWNISITPSSGGQFYTETGVPPGFGYTYIAVDQADSKIKAISPSADFTTLSPGTYTIYGVSYSTVGTDPATFVGSTLVALGSCVAASVTSITMTVNAASTSYGVSIGTFSNGSVATDKTTAASGETVTLTINPTTGYELDILTVKQTDAPYADVTFTGTNNTRTFTMPAYGVTVTATFKKNAATLLADAKAIVEGTAYTVAQATANDDVTVKAWLANTINTLLTDKGIDAVPDTDIELPSLSPAASGVDGSFNFTATLRIGSSNTTTASKPGVITATPLVDAETPVINTHPVGATYNEGATATALSITIATISDGGTPSYKWYSNATNVNSGGTQVSTDATYIPSTTTVGTTYYYVVVTNNKPSATGLKEVSATSNTALVTVVALVNAASPTINTPPQSATYNVGATTVAALTVEATSPNSGNLYYQWYKNTTNNNTSGTAISGAITKSYTPSVATAGTTYYYVVVTNENISVTGSKTTSLASITATITVSPLVNALPPAIGTQPASTTVNVGAAVTLTVVATSQDSGTLSYQWYSNTTDNTTSGTEISGATTASYSYTTAIVGTTYYYVVVTNTNDALSGTKTATTTSNTAKVEVNALVNAVYPVINLQPQDATYNVGETATALTVSATVTDNGVLSYEWFSNSTNSSSGGTSVATTQSYTPSTSTLGASYYYVVVTNTKTGVSGSETATTTSQVATITVIPLVDAQTPVISAQPQDKIVSVGTSTSLSVTATITDAGVLSYQWYSNSTNSTTGGTPVGTNSNSYAPPVDVASVKYYYVIVTNTNNAATGQKVVAETSNVATVTVNDLVNAETPVITSDPAASTTAVMSSTVTLTVVVQNLTDGGTLSYQWYSNTSNSNTGGTVINGATSNNYSPPTSAVGTSWYYVVVTNTNNSAAITGQTTVPTTSNVAEVTVNTAVNAATPVITGHPASTTATVNASVVLSVTATLSDSGILSYQWYSNSTNSNSGGSAISGATSATYSPSTATSGTFYYYVVVTNTNSGATGATTAATTSNAATVTVNTAVNAAAPIISEHPAPSSTASIGGTVNLLVTATSSDSGTLTYQWYSNSTESNVGGAPLSGETGSGFTAPTTAIGTTYYYVVVINTNSAATGAQTATATSNVATVTVNNLVNAEAPSITVQPAASTTTNVGSAVGLSVTASVTDGGTLSYQWYSNTTNSNAGGTLISGATSDTYSPSTATAGTTYYYVIVINTNGSVSGVQTASTTSSVASVTLNSLINATVPVITGNPQSVSYNQGDYAAALTVTASSPDGGTLSYQWYRNSTNSNTGGTAVGTNNSSYTPSTASVGTTYYYVVVTNTNTAVNGTQTATATSTAASVSVSAVITPPVVNTYSVYIELTTNNGTVTANPSTAEAGTIITLTITPAEGYELDAISATGATLSGSGNTRTFTMPASNVTITATFKKTQAQKDKDDVEAAKIAIEGGTFHIAQATGNTEAEVKTWLKNVLSVLLASRNAEIILRSGDILTADITLTAITPAIEGTEVKPNGTNGSFKFKGTLSKGSAVVSTIDVNGVIVATPHASTPVKRIELLSLSDLIVHISNTGNIETGALNVTLSGADASAFTLSSSTLASLTVGSEANIILTPHAGLAPRLYTATLTVSGEGLDPVTITITYWAVTTGLESIDGNHVWTLGSSLYIYSTTTGEAKVFNVSGQYVKTVPYLAGETVSTKLLKGIFLVTVEGKTYKVLIKND
ncbi:hypothetical protein AGMMS49574_07640 [Bacteroidia bacterium]|nr:hypothetical protein AGMMS49574_07640 [Bacteroidia bacterium]